MQLRGVLETCLYALDLDAAEAFYTGKLGLPVLQRETGRHVFFRCGDGVFLIFNPSVTSTVAAQSHGPSAPPHGARGPGHAAFRIHPDEIPGWRERLQNSGVPIEAEIVWPNGGHSLYFRDPAGNSLELATPTLWGLEMHEHAGGGGAGAT